MPSGTTHSDELGVLVEHTDQGVRQHLAVVDVGAHHHLAVHGDAVVEQRPQPAQARSASAVAQHPRPHLGVGGVDADVERAQALADHPLEVGLGEAGERGEVAVEEAQPVVVVLLVQAGAHARRQLVDEAELAVVVAGADLVEQGRVHLGPVRPSCGWHRCSCYPPAPPAATPEGRRLPAGLLCGNSPRSPTSPEPTSGDDTSSNQHPRYQQMSEGAAQPPGTSSLRWLCELLDGVVLW